METVKVSKRQQPDQKAENSHRPQIGLHYSDITSTTDSKTNTEGSLFSFCKSTQLGLARMFTFNPIPCGKKVKFYTFQSFCTNLRVCGWPLQAKHDFLRLLLIMCYRLYLI